MNTENNSLDRLRKAWRETGDAMGNDAPNPDDLDKKKTALDNLRDRYKSFWVMALALGFGFGTFMIFRNIIDIESDLGLPLALSYWMYFMICFGMDCWLWNGVRKINPVTMSVSEVASKALFYHKRHLQFMCVLLPLAVALVGFTAYAFRASSYFVYGIIAGAVIGAIMGIIQFRRFMASYRQLSA